MSVTLLVQCYCCAHEYAVAENSFEKPFRRLSLTCSGVIPFGDDGEYKVGSGSLNVRDELVAQA